MGSYGLSSWGMSIAMDELERQCFIGDSSGRIHFLKITSDNKCQLNTTLNGHEGKKNSGILN